MINIVNVNIHCDDQCKVTAMDIKFKACPEELINNSNQHLIARISAAFNSLALFSEYGKSFRMEQNPKRQNIANMHITFWENILSFKDVGEFIEELQKALLNSPF